MVKPIDVVNRFADAIVGGDFAAAMEMLTADFGTASGPKMPRLSASLRRVNDLRTIR